MSISDVPPEILDRIHQYLSGDDSLSLCYASNNIFCKSLLGKYVFRNLFKKCWLGNESFEEAKFVVTEIQKNWRELGPLKVLNKKFLIALKNQSKHERHRMFANLCDKKYVVGRICADLSLIHKNLGMEDLLKEINGDEEENSENLPKVLLKKSHSTQDTTYFMPNGSMIPTPTSTTSVPCSSKAPLGLEDISNTIITYAISKSHIALVISVKAPIGIRVSVWGFTSTSINHLYLTTTDHILANHKATINEEDILANERFLFTLPVSDIKTPLLQVFDMEARCLPLVATFALESGLRRVKPLIEKEGSAMRLHIYQDRLVVIVPLPHWTIYILDISPLNYTNYTHNPLQGVINLNCVFRRRLGSIEPATLQPFTFYASDQTDSVLLLGFAQKHVSNHRDSPHCPQSFLTFDLKEFSVGSIGRVYTYKDSDWGEYSGMIPRIPYLTEEEEVINTGVAHECFLATSSIINKFAILTNKGAVLIMDRREVTMLDLMEKCRVILGKDPEIFNPQDTFYDQLELSGEDHLLALKVITPHKLLFCLSFSGLVLWSVDLSSPQFNMNPSQRIFILSSHPVIFITDPSCSTILSADSGKIINQIEFPTINRKTEEPPRDTYYGYAACAYGAWEVVRTGNKIIYVHDIERCHPVIFDVFFI